MLTTLNQFAAIGVAVFFILIAIVGIAAFLLFRFFGVFLILLVVCIGFSVVNGVDGYARVNGGDTGPSLVRKTDITLEKHEFESKVNTEIKIRKDVEDGFSSRPRYMDADDPRVQKGFDTYKAKQQILKDQQNAKFEQEKESKQALMEAQELQRASNPDRY